MLKTAFFKAALVYRKLIIYQEKKEKTIN